MNELRAHLIHEFILGKHFGLLGEIFHLEELPSGDTLLLHLPPAFVNRGIQFRAGTFRVKMQLQLP